MSSFLYRLGRRSAERPWLVIAVWAAAAIVIVVASIGVGREMEDSFDVPGVDSQRATELLESASSDRAGLTARVVATPTSGDDFSTPDARSALDQLRSRLDGLDSAIGVEETISPDGGIAMLTIQYPVLDQLAMDDLDELKDVVSETRAELPMEVEAGGDLFFAYEEAGGSAAEMIGIAAAIVILLVAFGSVIAMGLPIGMAIFGLVLGVAAMPLISHVVMIPSWAPQLGTMIGLGVGIDYALFLVTRHREFLAEGSTVPDAAGRAVATAGQAVVFAGGTVVIAILGLGVAGVPFMTAAGIATSVIVAIMVIASITILPAFLGLSGHSINRFGIHRRGHAAGDVGPGWRRWGNHVTRHAWPYAIVTTVALLAMTAPVLALQLGFPDEGTQPESTTQRRAYDLVADGFGAGINGPLVVAVDHGGDVTVVDDVAAAVATDPGIAAVAPPEIGPAVGTVIAFPTSAPQDDATFETVERLRAEVLPDAVDGTTATAHVGGQTANFGDVAMRVSDRLPWFIAAVIVLSFLLLTIVFRSILVPLKAAVLNLLSIGAAYGVLVMVFQWGWGKELIGLETTVPIVSFIPMFMFAVLFGLSMDYEVFLLSRVREEYVATGDNDASVIAGLASTARVITSAALIMISVFGGFVLGDDPVTKMFGLGLATAILVDATIVRCILVPATMTLMGDANWWLPDWLDRRLPAVDMEGVAGLPEQEFEDVPSDRDAELVTV
ncbi:RND superfamily putative drug exporter [Ilumatobacter fluminis]|uniref:RND superfamily putative drug exporter n=1 Tax=Ilumatobacter fluminis TaxID=467091 RepID=A0A4R7HZ88_9ACTN|nr:MMPL family transporter [Ilumatobacter fluminis]TDT16557.1 RND superfamily putative drug exporter [Ilumatobacter fluminis]